MPVETAYRTPLKTPFSSTGGNPRVNPIGQLPLEPLLYHTEMVRYLQTHEADLWKWFSTDRLRTEQNEAVRLDLLKSTYRIERDASPAIYEAADEVAAKLKVQAPVTFYQCQAGGALNASLAYMPGEVHVVLVGHVASTLTPVELRGVMGHELAHFTLLDGWREYMVASQILAAMTNDAAADSSHHASARLFRLYSEVYSDRGSYLATGDAGATITALVKLETGSTEVTAESYLRQADEIFAKGNPHAEGVTHPEIFIRAKAVKLWADQSQTAAMEIAALIEGPLALADLDLLGQLKLSALTRRLIERFLQPKWLQTEPILAHAKLFFDDFQPLPVQDKALADELKDAEDRLRDYYCYVLLDFAAADRDLEEAPLAAALLTSDELGMGERFRQLAGKELNIRKKQLAALEADASKIVTRAAEGDAQT